MTTSEALQIIDQVVGNVAGTRADHQKIAEAMEVLVKAVEPVKK